MTLSRQLSLLPLITVKKLLFIFVFIGISTYGFSQYVEPCATNSYLDFLESQYPGIKQNVDYNYQKAVAASKAINSQFGKADPIDTTYVVQVVFHVIYNTDEQNIAERHVLEELDVINACFNRQNADTINTREVFKPVAGSSRIQFELASVDPMGNPTNGITRRKTNLNTFSTGGSASKTDYVKHTATGGTDAWNTDKYLNVWICNLNIQGIRVLFGYAFPPVNAAFWDSEYYKGKDRQGVVLHYETVGPNNPADLDASIYTNEKTAVHEIGHYFGLRHVWGDSRFNGCNADDFIDDTPPSIAATRGCPENANTCSGDNLPDQVENYMDYGSAICSNMFTVQQIGVMRYNMVNLRPGLAEEVLVYKDIPDVKDLTLYPNPATDYIEFFWLNITEEPISIQVLNYLGQEVLNQTQVKTDYITRFDHIDLANGYYRVKVMSGNEVILEQSILLVGH